MTARLFTTILACAALSASVTRGARADGDEAPPPPAFELAADRVIVRRGPVERTVRIGCVAHSFTSLGTRAYVLCGASTIIIVDAAQPVPQIMARARLVDHILSLTTIDGVVSARSASGVKPLNEYAAAPPYAVEQPDAPLEAPPKPRRRYYDDAQRPKPIRIPPITGLELGATATGGLGFDNIVGAFTMLDASLVYRFDVPFSLSGYATVGAATGAFDNGLAGIGPRGGDVQLATAEAIVSIEAPIVAVGIGLGVGMMDTGYEVEPLFVTRGRVGEVDGFDFRWHMSFATSGRTIIGALGGSLEFRLTEKWWLGTEAEFSDLRYGRFMLTARHRLLAQKDHQGPTFDLRLGAGVAYVQSSSDCGQNNFLTTSTSDSECIGTNTDYLGPAFSLGLVFRP